MTTPKTKKKKQSTRKFVTDTKVLLKEMEKASKAADKRNKMLEQASCVSQELLRLEVSM